MTTARGAMTATSSGDLPGAAATIGALAAPSGLSREKNPPGAVPCAGCGHSLAAHMRTVKGTSLVGRCAFVGGCPCRKYQAPADPPKLPKPLDEGVF